MVADAVVDDHPHQEEAGEAGAEVGAEEAVEVVILVTGHAHTLDQGAGHHEGVCHGRHTADRRRGHPLVVVEEAAVAEDTAGEIHPREEEGEVVEVAEGGEAQAMIYTIVQDREAGAETADEEKYHS
jgi:hypothetical protein